MLGAYLFREFGQNLDEMSDTTGSPRKRNASFLRSLSRVALGRLDILVASLSLNLLTLALPLVILQVYDKIIPNEASSTFALMVAGLCVVVILDFVLRSIRSYITNWESARFEHAISGRAVEKLLNADIEAFEQTPPGTHMDRVSAIEQLRDFHSGQGLIAISDLPFVVIFLAIIYLISSEMVYAPLVVVAIATVFAMFLGFRLESVVRRRSHLDDQRYNFVFQVLNGVHTIKGLGLEAQMTRRYEALLRPLASAVQKEAFLATAGRALGPVFSAVAMFSVAAFGSQKVIAGDLTSGSLVACTLLAGRAVQPLIRMIGVWVQSQNLKLAEERLDELLALPQEGPAHPTSESMHELEGDFTLEDVTVHRGRPEWPLLSNVDLKIYAGEIVAVTGPLGGGKSAFLEMFAGFIRPDGGKLLIDGIDSVEIDFKHLRQQIGYVGQNGVLYRGSILDNVTKFRGRAHLGSALKVANEIGLDRDLATMPKGLRTIVGDAASESLAGSVQQMISLVRVFSGEPKLILLDEANSALDMDADTRLRRMIEDKRSYSTVIMVTSRPSMIRIADKVLKVDRGMVSDITPTDPSLVN